MLSMSKHLLFIYGSLRRDSERAMSITFPDARFIAEARVNGSLYDFGPYPGLILDGSSSTVTGEAYEVDDQLLEQLDDFEGSSNYHRQPVEISFADEKRMGWTYEPNPEFYALVTPITSGDWIEHSQTKQVRGQ
jgi:gamma-glutamylcyclotransferase (GGCT)/AIG2-like uncharacterized protein YtfP